MSEEGPLRGPSCVGCGAFAMRFVGFVSRLGDQLAQNIYQCNACEALHWQAEAIGPDGDEPPSDS